MTPLQLVALTIFIYTLAVVIGLGFWATRKKPDAGKCGCHHRLAVVERLYVKAFEDRPEIQHLLGCFSDDAVKSGGPMTNLLSAQHHINMSTQRIVMEAIDSVLSQPKNNKNPPIPAENSTFPPGSGAES